LNIRNLADEIIDGRRLKRGENFDYFLTADINELSFNADRIRKAVCGDDVHLCTIINGKSGRCSENCKFCAQSACHSTNIDEYSFLDSEEILKECRHNADMGVHRFAIVTAGRALSGEAFEKALDSYKLLKDECNIGLCASLGLISDEQFKRLYESGVRVYHCNIVNSERNFPEICTSHTFKDKIECIKRAKNNGFKVCSGGII